MKRHPSSDRLFTPALRRTGGLVVVVGLMLAAPTVAFAGDSAVQPGASGTGQVAEASATPSLLLLLAWFALGVATLVVGVVMAGRTGRNSTAAEAAPAEVPDRVAEVASALFQEPASSPGPVALPGPSVAAAVAGRTIVASMAVSTSIGTVSAQWAAQ